MLKNFYKSISLTVILTLIFLPVRGFALPEGGIVTQGSGTIPTPGPGDTSMTITQNSDRMIADFNTFNIAQPETVTFNQHLNSDIAVNRIHDVNPSQILGTLTANGRIFLLNPNGIVFGQGCSVNTAGLVASSLNMVTSDADFMAGAGTNPNPLSFSGGGAGPVTNAGALSAPGGFVALLGPNITNTGTILANVGTIDLASGSAMTLSLDALNLVSVAISSPGDPGSAAAGVVNSGTLQAASGRVYINGQVIASALKNAVNNSGIIEGQEISIEGNGNIEILAGGKITASANSGDANVWINSADGNIDVTGSDILAEVTGVGSAEVDLFAGDYSRVDHDFPAPPDDPEKTGGIIESLHGNGSINIKNGSSILASLGSGYDGANIRVEAQDITIDNSDITSNVIGDGRAQLGISAGSYDFYHQYNVNRDRIFDGGNLVISGGSSILSTTGSNVAVWRDNFLNIDAGNIDITDASKVTAQSIASGHAEVDITAYNHFERINDRDYPTATGGSLDIRKGSSILAQAVGSASADIQLNSGTLEDTINIDGSSVMAELTGEGLANVSITSGNYSHDGQDFYGGDLNIKNLSTVSAIVNGSGEAYIGVVGGKVELKESGSLVAQALGGNSDWAEVDIIGEDTVNVLSGSSILAQTSSNSYGSEIYIQGADILVDASFLTADVGGNADGFAGIFLGHDPEESLGDFDVETRNISILNGSKLDAKVEKGKTYAYSTVEMDLTESFNIKNNSELSAISTVTDPSGKGYAYLDFNLYGDKGNFDVIGGSAGGSTLLAKVNGEGHADITLYDTNNAGYWAGNELINQVAGLFSDGEINSGPINGKVEISGGSTLHAEAASNSGFDFGNNNPDTAVIGMMSEGPITITGGSSVSATELNGPAIVGLLSGSNIAVDGSSTVSATTSGPESLAVVGIAALGSDEDGNSINMSGTITANGGSGNGLVALLGLEALYAPGTIQASGSNDVIPYLNDFFDPLTLGEMDTFGSAVLLGSNGDITIGNVAADLVGIGSLYGSIYQAPGQVRAKYLAMIAEGDIGTSPDDEADFPGPINTDVDVLSAYSWDEGDIFINEANSLEVGLFLPLGEYIDGVFEPSSAFQFGVSANDGMISIVSQGDMLVNSVIAPRGGVFLQSAQGSIYAGHVVDPTVYDENNDYLGGTSLQDMASFIEEGFSSFTDMFSGMAVPAQGDIEDFLRSSLMDVTNTPWGNGAYYNFEYFSPAMTGPFSGCNECVPNVIAGGYSYFSTPHGTIGVGSPGNKDSAISGEISGDVDPQVQAVTGTRGPGIDLSRYTPPGLVYFYNGNNEEESVQIEQVDDEVPPYNGPQIWPGSIADPAISSGNPLAVSILVNSEHAGDMRALPQWFLDSFAATSSETMTEQISEGPQIAALTLEIGPAPQQSNPSIDDAALLANALKKYLRAYYEIMIETRFQSMEPVTPTNFFGYHPLTPTDMTAFDNVVLDEGAYDFISDNLKLKKKPAPYFGE